MSHITAAALFALPLASALDLRSFPDASAGAGFVHIPLSVKQTDVKRIMSKRATKSASADLTNLQSSGYTINITIAGQPTSVIVDTGSYELWVNPVCSDADRDLDTNGDGEDDLVAGPGSTSAYCEEIGRYDPSSSDTSKSLNEGTQFVYADFTTVTANYYTDTLDIGGLNIKNQQFAVANASNSTALGIMGIGPPSAYGFDPAQQPYSLILDSLASQGLINSRVFSLDLRDYDNTTGSLIFGGVDKGKFSGSLTRLPMETQNVTGEYSDGTKVEFTDYSYYVTVSSVGITKPNTTLSSAYSQDTFLAVVDSGTGALLLPPGLSADICTDLDGSWLGETGTGNCLIDCAVRAQSGGVDVGFSVDGKRIQVEYANIVTPVPQGNGQPDACFLGAGDSTIVSDPPTYILGAPFLRSAYAVFDWDNRQIALAQAADCGSDAVAVGNGTDAVPTDGGCGGDGSSSGSDEGSGTGRGVVGNMGLMALIVAVSAMVLL